MLAALVLAATLPAHPPGRCVLDQPGVLKPAEGRTLENLCEELDRADAGQLAVAIVDDLGDYGADDFATELFTKWGLGHKGRDDGVLVLLKVGPPGHRDIRVRVGYGLEGALPDGKVGAMIDQLALPRLREGRWGEGLIPLVQALSDEAKRENASGAVERRAQRKAAEDAAAGQAAQTALVMFFAAVIWALTMAGFAAARRIPGRGVRLAGGGAAAAGLAAVLFNGMFAGPMVLAWGVFTFVGVVAFWAVGRHRCPRCGGWLRLRETVLRRPTYRENGIAELERTCTRCSFSTTDRRVLPRRTRTAVFVGGGWGGGGWGGGGGGGGGWGGGGGGSTGGGGAGRSF